LIQSENRLLQEKAAAMHEEELKQSPVRLPYESPEIDHHKNQYEVALKLLREDWPRVSRALDECHAAKTEEAKKKAKEKVHRSYIADHMAIYGARPAIRAGEEADLWKDDFLIRLMSDALNGPQGKSTGNWQTAG
jgi:hypothetical protein